MNFIITNKNKKHNSSQQKSNFKKKKIKYYKVHNADKKIIGYHIHSHLFRHSAVSQLYSQNVPLELISNLVGHSGTTITEKVYLHQTEEKKQALSTFMDSLID